MLELKLALLLPKPWSFLDLWQTSASVLILNKEDEERRRRRSLPFRVNDMKAEKS